MCNRNLLLSLVVLSVLMASCKTTPPAETNISISSSPLSPCSLTSIHVRVVNKGDQDWMDNKLVLFFESEPYIDKLDPQSAGVAWKDYLGYIGEFPLSLPAGQVFESDIPWLVGYIAHSDKAYQVQLFLLSPDEKQMAETSIPVEFVYPTITLAVSPTQLTLNSEATISVQVSNPSAAGLACIVDIAYGASDNSGREVIKSIPVALEPGETLHQDIAWTVDYIETYGDNMVEAALFVPELPSPDNKEVVSMLLSPETWNYPMFKVAFANVPITFFQP
jgi:hypothetical protein